MFAGINPVDTYIRSGTYPVKPTLPYTPGRDACGYVEEIGKDVDSVQVTLVFIFHLFDLLLFVCNYYAHHIICW